MCYRCMKNHSVSENWLYAVDVASPKNWAIAQFASLRNLQNTLRTTYLGDGSGRG